MATKSVCTQCLRSMRLQARNGIQHASRTRASPKLYIAHFTRSLSTATPLRREERFKKSQPPPVSEDLQSSGQKDAITNFAKSVRSRDTFKFTTEPYIAYGGTEDLFKECARQCSYTIPNALKQPPEPPPKNAGGEDIGVGEGWWYRSKEDGGLGLDITFNAWAQVMYLHMYMLTVRLRAFPAEHARVWHQNLLDHFFYAAEDKMALWHGMAARGIRNKHLKDLLLQWRGVLFSYDEGLISGDAVLAGAVWRNIFKASEQAQLQDLAIVVAYIRSQLQMLDGISDEKLAGGEVKFGDAGSLKGLLDKESSLMKKSFTAEELKGVESISA